MLYAFILMARVLVAEGVVASAVHAAKPETDTYLAVKGAGGLFILLVGGCIAGPTRKNLWCAASYFAAGPSPSSV